jgi:hypothetical protein
MAVFLTPGTSTFVKAQKKAADQIQAYNSKPKNITVIFADITNSDTGKAWTSRPFRDQFDNAVNTCLTSSQDVMAAYLIHGKTKDEQPFWTNAPLSSIKQLKRGDSALLISGGLEKQLCIEAFDSIASRSFLHNGNLLDSMLAEYTDVFGAFQQAALYFRRYATSSRDTKRIFLLSDTKENAGFVPGSIKLNNIGSIDTARMLAGLALEQIKKTTDIKNELKDCDVYILSTNNRLYYNEERNLRRIFWETLLINKLHCNKVYFF